MSSPPPSSQDGREEQVKKRRKSLCPLRNICFKLHGPNVHSKAGLECTSRPGEGPRSSGHGCKGGGNPALPSPHYPPLPFSCRQKAGQAPSLDSWAQPPAPSQSPVSSLHCSEGNPADAPSLQENKHSEGFCPKAYAWNPATACLGPAGAALVKGPAVWMPRVGDQRGDPLQFIGPSALSWRLLRRSISRA